MRPPTAPAAALSSPNRTRSSRPCIEFPPGRRLFAVNLPAFSSEPTTPHHALNRRDGDLLPFQVKSKPFLVTPMRQTRILAMLGIFLGWTVLIGGRLVWLQGVQHPAGAARGARPQEA